MAKLQIKPLDDRMVVEQSEAESKTAGGIVLPDAAKEKPQRGKVLATGPGKLLDSGERGQMSVKVGDHVYYGKYTAGPRSTSTEPSTSSCARATYWRSSSKACRVSDGRR